MIGLLKTTSLYCEKSDDFGNKKYSKLVEELQSIRNVEELEDFIAVVQDSGYLTNIILDDTLTLSIFDGSFKIYYATYSVNGYCGFIDKRIKLNHMGKNI